MPDEPTIGEAVRRLDAVSKQIEVLTRQLAEDRRDFASTYVRHDLYEARHLSLDRRVTIMENAHEEREREDADKRRQLMFILLTVALTSVASLMTSLVSIALRG